MSEELLHEQTQTEAAVTMADLEEHFDDANPWNVVKSYMEKGTILPVKVEGIVNGGAIAMIEGIRGFIPASRLSLSYIEDLETYLLKDIEVRVIDVDEANNRLVLSAREILQEKARKEREARIAAVKVGSIVTGTVESLQNYGAFVDLGDGLSGLVHISQISLKRIKSPSDVLNVGDEVNVKIIGVKDGKISLSMKALEEEKKEEDMTPEELEKKAEEDAYKMEIQSNSWKNWPQGPGTYGEAAIVMDAGTGSILYAKNIDGHEYPASITKVLTSLIALKYGSLSDQVTFSNDCISFMQPGCLLYTSPSPRDCS